MAWEALQAAMVASLSLPPSHGMKTCCLYWTNSELTMLNPLNSSPRRFARMYLASALGGVAPTAIFLKQESKFSALRGSFCGRGEGGEREKRKRKKEKVVAVPWLRENTWEGGRGTG